MLLYLKFVSDEAIGILYFKTLVCVFVIPVGGGSNLKCCFVH